MLFYIADQIFIHVDSIYLMNIEIDDIKDEKEMNLG
jgi:hypothetical protein